MDYEDELAKTLSKNSTKDGDMETFESPKPTAWDQFIHALGMFTFGVIALWIITKFCDLLQVFLGGKIVVGILVVAFVVNILTDRHKK